MAVLAIDYYTPGDVICEEKPFIRVLKQEMWDKVCSGCLKSDPFLKKCGACGVMKFCGKSCQKIAWPDHKLECPYLPNYTDFRFQEFVHMIGNIILKINGRNWKTVTKNILGKKVSFADLMSHAHDSMAHNTIVDTQAIKDPLLSYIGKEKMPNNETLLELFGKVQHNRFGFTCENSSSKRSEGWALFVGVSKLDHSCVPNAAFHISGETVTIRAFKTIQKTEKVTIAYSPMISSVQSPFLRMARERGFGGKCNCSDCSQQFGKSDLTKILDYSKASEVLEEVDCTLELVSYLSRLGYPADIVSFDKLKLLLLKQEGVLGKTHLSRMRTLRLIGFDDRPIKDGVDVGLSEDRSNDLVELVNSMKKVWGEYYPELCPIYRRLITMNMALRNVQVARDYTRKISLVEAVCFGKKLVLEDDIHKKILEHILADLP